ncbi:MAG: glutamate 5-kinase [Spirochaetia bacterium]|nr:glutamate 5-kinase [Spirochaetia bacterium]
MNFENIENQLKKNLEKCTHVVIKIGTGVLNPHIENTDFEFFQILSREVKNLQQTGKKVLIVSSGAVGFGKKIRSKKINGEKLGNSIVDKQAYAALGQSFLINTYREYLANVDLDAAQILITMADFKSRNHFHNMKRALDQLLAWGSVPIINENDTVAIDEKFGDNDTISAMITGMYEKSVLIILTTIDGFYIDNQKIDVLQDIDKIQMRAAGGASAGGIGGMKTKLMAGKKIIQSGQLMNISAGKNPGIIREVVAGARVGTWFVPMTLESLGAKKRWLLHYRQSMGELFIDEGARRAIISAGASLLAVGIKRLSGDFEKGDVVTICDLNGEALGMGAMSLSSTRIANIISDGTEKKGIEAIHRDNLALLASK